MSYELILMIVHLVNAAIVLVLGCAIGSFLNVVIYRVPADLSLWWPPSRCPKCFHELGVTENIPVFGWLRLGGRCAHCRTPISARYPIIEAITGAIFLAAFYLNGETWSIALVSQWVMLAWLLALAMIDIDTMTLPNPLTQWGVAMGLGFNVAIAWQASIASGSTSWTDQLAASGAALFASVLGAMVGLWGLDTLRLLGSIAFGKEAMGAGDSKLMAGVGAWLGWPLALLTVFVACAIGAVVGSVAIALKWVARSQPIPFGPFLAIGAAIALIWGQVMIDAYLGLFLPTGG
jgi:leader peptidase (prepilin peptidase)/N-methyltransferase